MRHFWDGSAEVSTRGVQKFIVSTDKFASSFRIFYSLDNCFLVLLLHLKTFFLSYC